jgi:hypothetical protein
VSAAKACSAPHDQRKHRLAFVFDAAGARALLQRVCAEAAAHLPTDTYLDVLAQLDLAQAQEELVRPPRSTQRATGSLTAARRMRLVSHRPPKPTIAQRQCSMTVRRATTFLFEIRFIEFKQHALLPQSAAAARAGQTHTGVRAPFDVGAE